MKYTGDVFKKFNNDKYSRVDALHKLDFFYGKTKKVMRLFFFRHHAK